MVVVNISMDRVKLILDHFLQKGNIIHDCTFVSNFQNVLIPAESRLNLVIEPTFSVQYIYDCIKVTQCCEC